MAVTSNSTPAPSANPTEQFDPADWLWRFEAAGGIFIATESQTCLCLALQSAPKDQRTAARALLAGLDEDQQTQVIAHIRAQAGLGASQSDLNAIPLEKLSERAGTEPPLSGKAVDQSGGSNQMDMTHAFTNALPIVDVLGSEIRASDIVFEVVDDTAEPHLHRGDFAIIDTTDRELIHGEMYLIEWSGGQRQIVDASLQFGRYGKNGVTTEGGLWFFGWMGRVLAPATRAIEVSRWRDGPYQTEQAMQKIVGKVVGIYEPDCGQGISTTAVQSEGKAVWVTVSGNQRVSWDAAMARYLATEAEATEHYDSFFGPASAAQEAWLSDQGVGLGGRGSDFWFARGQAIDRYPERATVDRIAEEYNKLIEAQVSLKWELMGMAAPDCEALCWKLDQAFEPDETGDTEIPVYRKESLRQTFLDYRRILGHV